MILHSFYARKKAVAGIFRYLIHGRVTILARNPSLGAFGGDSYELEL